MASLSAKRPGSGLLKEERRDGWLFSAPFVIGFLVFLAGPMLYSLFLVSQEWTLIRPPRYTGLANVERALQDPLVLKSLYNSAYLTFLGVPLQLLLAFGLALALNQSIRGRPIYRTVFYVPTIVPVVCSAVLFRQLFSYDFGMFNNILRAFGREGVNWLFVPAYAKPALMIMTLWSVGGYMIIFLAGLQGVPVQLKEAAALDGAGVWASFWNVTVPIISPTIFFNFITGVIYTMQIFAQALIMTRGGPQNATLFMVLYVYVVGFTHYHMGYAATLSWILFAVIMTLSFIQFRMAKEWVYYEVTA